MLGGGSCGEGAIGFEESGSGALLAGEIAPSRELPSLEPWQALRLAITMVAMHADPKVGQILLKDLIEDLIKVLKSNCIENFKKLFGQFPQDYSAAKVLPMAKHRQFQDGS